MQILAICSPTRSLQSTGKRVFRDGIHKLTDKYCDLKTELAQRADAVKIKVCIPLQFLRKTADGWDKFQIADKIDCLIIDK